MGIKGTIKEVTGQINPNEIISRAVMIPGVKIDRDSFLRRELMKQFPEDKVELAIETNPAQAGIPRRVIDQLADECIKYETRKVTAISAAAGIPGGLAMIATAPADIISYFGFMLRIAQKLIYLYGFSEINFNENYVDDETMNQMILFVGVMLGVKGATDGIKALALRVSASVSKNLAEKAITKGVVYSVAKEVAKVLGIKMTKQVFAEGVAKVIPVMGAVTSGGITFLSFKACCNRLQKNLSNQKICKPAFYGIEEINVERHVVKFVTPEDTEDEDDIVDVVIEEE